jgi:hypothetical protein
MRPSAGLERSQLLRILHSAEPNSKEILQRLRLLFPAAQTLVEA